MLMLMLMLMRMLMLMSMLMLLLMLMLSTAQHSILIELILLHSPTAACNARSHLEPSRGSSPGIGGCQHLLLLHYERKSVERL